MSGEQPKMAMGAEGSAPAIISDHPFQVKGKDVKNKYWKLCDYRDPDSGKKCNLAMSAHAETRVPNEPPASVKRAKPDKKKLAEAKQHSGNGKVDPATAIEIVSKEK